jgi:hypothetical protein
MHIHAKIQNIINCSYLQTNILVFEFLQFCTRNYCTTVNLLKRSPTKLSLQFYDIPIKFYEFWKFELFFAI